MKTEKRLTMALSVLVALMMLAVPLASSSNLFVDGGQTNSNGDAPSLSASSNDDITIKDVYIVKTAAELKALPIYESWSKQSGYTNIAANSNGYYPCLVTVYNVSDNALKNDYKVKFSIDYKNYEDGKKYAGGFSGMSDYLTHGKDHYYIVSLGSTTNVSGDNDCLGISDPKNYYNQVYTVTAELYKNSEKVPGSDVSMDTGADGVTINEVWMIDDQASFEKIRDVHGKNLDDFISGGKWTKVGNDERKPWVAVAFTATSPGAVTISIDATGMGKIKPFTMTFTEAGKHVFVATVGNDQDGGTGDKLGITEKNVWENNTYQVIASVSNGQESIGSVTYGNASSTYDVIFKLNSDETSLDIAEKIGKLSDVSEVVTWKTNADGDLVASVTISNGDNNSSKVSIEYLITQIFDKIKRNGYTLTEWASDDGNYTNMSYDTHSGKDNASDYSEGKYFVDSRDKAIDKNMTFTATWELNEGYVEVPVHVYQDDVLVGDFIKTYKVIEKNTIFIETPGLAEDIKKATGINTYGIIVNDAKLNNNGIAAALNVKASEVYSSKVTYGSDNDLPANSKIASNSELTVNYNLNDRLYSKITIHSEAFKDGKDITLFALKNKDYTYAEVFAALQQEDETHGIKNAAIVLGSGFDKDKNAITKDNYYLLTGWNDGAELLDSSRNAPAELTLDTELNGYYVIFMVNGQFEVVYIPFGELSADKCTIASGVKYWSYVSYAEYINGISKGEIKTFSFTKSQIDGIEKLVEKREHLNDPIAVFIGSEYSFNNTAYAVFDASENDGNFGNKYVDKMIVSGKASSGTTKTTIPMPEVSPVYENTVVLVGYKGYTAIGTDATTFGSAGYVDEFTANVVEYEYTITFYNGSDVNGIFYYGNVSTMGDKDITPGLVAFSYKGTAYQISDTSDEATKAYNNVLFPAKDGYKLTQWKDSDGNVMIDKVKKNVTSPSGKDLTTITYEVKFKKVSSDMSFYANFEAQKFGIVYSGNTATATNNMVQVGSVDEALTLFKDSTFSNDGYKLTGWNTRPDGDGTSYKLGDSFTLNGAQFEDLSSIKGIDNVPADVEYGFTLYAIWEKSSSGSGSGDNNEGNDSNMDTYLLAGILAVIIILILLIAFLMRRKQ